MFIDLIAVDDKRYALRHIGSEHFYEHLSGNCQTRWYESGTVSRGLSQESRVTEKWLYSRTL
jgi:hypothetical protein